ncbi:putative disease resistance protein RGA3 [Pistacia vera]|uniref:putative disease resistance protein RGA3 n=1 Tax=Pistacia vera TaxID=55513 RepID=UPI00126347F2|nr:putative disease resistance protein RGA3 [Pistacia vera]
MRVEDEIDKLRHSISIIQVVLQDAEERQVKEKAMKIWLGELKEVAHDADNLLDEFCLEALMAKSRGFFMTRLFTDFFPSLKPIAVYLEFLAAERLNFNLKVLSLLRNKLTKEEAS